jgi:hypothetical protein
MAGKMTIDRARVAELARKGLAPAQIAGRMGCSARQVQRILRELKEAK